MSEPTLGFAVTRSGSRVQVLARHGGGAVIVDLRTLDEIRLDAGQLGELRELLDRAAMPGARVKHGPGCGCTPCKAEPGYRTPGQVSDGG